MTEPVTLDDWLAAIYRADLHNQKDPVVSQFVTALGGNSSLKTAAEARLAELNAMIAARGELACSFSTKYRNYLTTVLS